MFGEVASAVSDPMVAVADIDLVPDFIAVKLHVTEHTLVPPKEHVLVAESVVLK